MSFCGVSFRFPDADENALTDLSFTCRKGETTAVIGGTGSGKTTIARLLLRFHDVTEGSVRVGGKDVRDISQRELRIRISYVPQKAWLFSGTVAENLCYGKEDASEEEMRKALRKALRKETEDAAVLIIAQRINTILNADQILVLDEGKIVGAGRHEELMERCSVYRESAESLGNCETGL